MKKLLFMMCLSAALIFAGCSGDDERHNALKAFARSGCKPNVGTEARSTDISDFHEDEIVRYEATTDGCLLLYHNNALFCCDTDIKATVSIRERVITIIEYHTPSTNCICPYDITMKIGPLNENSYTICIYRDIEANMGSSTPQTEFIKIPIQYSTDLKGEHVVNQAQ